LLSKIFYPLVNPFFLRLNLFDDLRDEEYSIASLRALFCSRDNPDIALLTAIDLRVDIEDRNGKLAFIAEGK